MAWKKVTNVRGKAGKDGTNGKQGPPGTYAAAEAFTVPASENARVEMFGPETAKGARFFVPRGLPAEGALDNDQIMAGRILAGDTLTNAAFRSLLGQLGVTVDALRYRIEDYLATDLERERWRVRDYQNGTYRIDPILQRAVDQLSALYNIDGRARVVDVPTGTYKMEVAVRPGHNGGVGLTGAGKDSTVFKSGPNNQFWAPSGDPNEGGWVEGVNPFYKDMTFANFTFDASAHVAYDGGTGWGGGNKKFFSLGHVRNSRFLNLRGLNTWSTAYGIDYNDGNLFFDCEAINCGRGRLTSANDERVGSGAGFGLGAGTFGSEMTYLIGCVAKGCGSNGIFFEQLNRAEAVHKAVGFGVIGCWVEGNYIGISDAGGAGAIITASTIIGNLRAGLRVGGTQPMFEGGRDGIASTNTITKNGIGVEIDNTCEGGYLVQGNNIFDNIVGLSWEYRGHAGRGVRVLANAFRLNKAAGILLRNGDIVSEAAIEQNSFVENGHNPAAAANLPHDKGAIEPGGIVVRSNTYRLSIRFNSFSRNAEWAVVWVGQHTHYKRRFEHNDYEDADRNPASSAQTTFSGGRADGNFVNVASTVENLVTMPVPKNSDGGFAQWATSGGAGLRALEAGGFYGGGQLRVTASAGFPAPTAGATAVNVPANSVVRVRMLVAAPVGTRVRPGVWVGSTFTPFSPPVAATGDWQEVSAVYRTTAAVTLRPGARVDQIAAGLSARFDGAQLTMGDGVYPFIWGGQAGSSWSGSVDASTSTRAGLVTVGNEIAHDPAKLDGWTNVGNAANMSRQAGGYFGTGQVTVQSSVGFPNPGVGSPFVIASPGEIWTGSVWVKGHRGDRVTVVIWEGTNLVDGYSVRADGEWQHLWITHRVSAGTSAIRVGARSVYAAISESDTPGPLIIDANPHLSRGPALPNVVRAGGSHPLVDRGDEWTGPAGASMQIRHLNAGIAA
ncbi:right-handed parallel beta-helix repeat-containing protein [Pseudoclavibacter helvolus]|uniref:hypothetical protein n=1 Tax=Pseudoclavibacter helvolus TaxID=255205 RepID=UPI0037366C03